MSSISTSPYYTHCNHALSWCRRSLHPNASDHWLNSPYSGRGDELHTLYAGLNYHFCGDNLKLMGGVEYASLDTPRGDADALTWLVAFRTFF